MATFQTLTESYGSVIEIQTQETPVVAGEFRVYDDGKCIMTFEYVGLAYRRDALRDALQTFMGLI
jgi:hypothetical protein